MLCKPSSRRRFSPLPTRAPARGSRESTRRTSKQKRSCLASILPTCSPSKTRVPTACTVQNIQPCYHRNQQYSVTALTNGGGAVVERYAYDAYGTPTILDASLSQLATSSENNRYLYTGREYDEALGLYHYRARIYNSLSGRFCSRDPIGFRGSEWGLYEFVGSNPTVYLDPTGTIGVASGSCPPGSVFMGGPGGGSCVSFPNRPNGFERLASQGPRSGGRNGSRGNCPTDSEILRQIAEINVVFLNTVLNDLAGKKNYASMPFQHCVWNCRMTLRGNTTEARILSLIKETTDVAICALGKNLSRHCFNQLSSHTQNKIVGYCCSANQPADYTDNATGRGCGNDGKCYYDPSEWSCEKCCNAHGITKETNDGPGTARPCGPFMPPWMNGLPGSNSL